MTFEADNVASGYIEGVILARVPALPYSHAVMSGINRYLDGLMVCERSGNVAINQDVKSSTSELQTKSNFVGHFQRC
jgi:hypothetical protein